MLFKQIYNWIKYKTIPSSVLYKNRLFLERDSKHRRIFSNFGLAFRNSKWTDYSSFNIQLSFKNKFFKSLFFFFLIVFVYFYINNFYNYNMFSYFFNNIYFILWSGIDSTDYFLSFLMWLFLAFFSLISNIFYSYFFFNNFSNKKNINNFYTDLNLFQFYKLHNIDYLNLQLSKKDYKWILYQWLKTTNNTKINQQKTLEILYNNNVAKKNWNKNYLFFNKLYKTLNYLILIENQSNLFYFIEKQSNVFLKNNNYGTFNMNVYLMKFFKDKNNFNLVINFYFWNKKNDYFNIFKTSDSLLFLKNNNLWHFSKIINKTSQHYNFLLNNKLNNFYLHSFNLNKLNLIYSQNNTYFILNNALLDQFNNAKWNRWLYKYSILHRKTFKISHKLTLSKKILNISLFNNNKCFNGLWLETSNNSFTNLSKQSSSLNNIFLNFENNKNNDNFVNYNLNLLNKYELSYFWFLKRFYFYNSLNTNHISTNLILTNNNTNAVSKNNDFNRYKLTLSYLLKSPNFFINQIAYINKKKINQNFYYNFKQINFFSNFNDKDIYLFNNDTFLFNKTNLFVFNWITLSNLNYFNLNFKNTNINDLYTENVFNENNKLNENIQFFELIFNIDNLNAFNFQKDLFLLYFFL